LKKSLSLTEFQNQLSCLLLLFKYETNLLFAQSHVISLPATKFL